MNAYLEKSRSKDSASDRRALLAILIPDVARARLRQWK